jgi:hypothetical protein
MSIMSGIIGVLGIIALIIAGALFARFVLFRKWYKKSNEGTK